LKEIVWKDDVKFSSAVELTFLDPPFNQNKNYAHHNDNLSFDEYWGMMKDVCQKIYDITFDGGAIYCSMVVYRVPDKSLSP